MHFNPLIESAVERYGRVALARLAGVPPLHLSRLDRLLHPDTSEAATSAAKLADELVDWYRATTAGWSVRKIRQELNLTLTQVATLAALDDGGGPLPPTTLVWLAQARGRAE